MTDCDFPPLAVVIYTHMRHPARLNYATRTLQSLARGTRAGARPRLHYSGPLHFHLADDQSQADYLRELELVAESLGHVPSTSSGQGRGYGASYNAATGRLHDDYSLYLCVEDDWELVNDLDLDPFVAALTARPDILGCIRLGYIGWATGEFYGALVEAAGNVYFLFSPASTEHHVFSGHPRLETRDWQRRLGLWPERLNAGATEWEVAGREASRIGVAWPLGVRPHSLFAHIGTIQAREDQTYATG